MAATGFTSTGAFLDTGFGIARIHGRIIYDVSRLNNTVTFSNAYAQIKYVRESGSWTSFTYGPGWTWRLYINTGTQRSSNGASGTRSPEQTDNGSSTGFSVGVSTGDSTYSGRIGAWFSGDSQTYTGTLTLNIPTVSGPANMPTPVLTTAAVRSLAINTGTSGSATWGNNVTSDEMRVEWRVAGSGSAWSNSGDLGGTMLNQNYTIQNLLPGTSYEVRVWAINGVGYTNTGSSATFQTLPAPNTSAALLKVVGVL